MNPIEAAARAALKPKDRRPPWQWIEENVGIRNSPFGNRPNFERTPWLKKPSEKFADNRIRMVTLQCCVQGSKSFFMQTHGIWALAQDPGPIGYYVQTNEFVGKVANGRWIPMVEDTGAVRALLKGQEVRTSLSLTPGPSPQGRGGIATPSPGGRSQLARHGLGKSEIYFTHTFAYVMAANESNTQMLSLRYVFCDDTFIWSEGMVKAAHERATRWWNRRIVNGTAGGEVDSESDANWRGGTMEEWRLMCPSCRRLQVPDVEKHLKWPTNEITKPGGEWNYEAVKRATRFRCEHCGTELPNTPETVRLMNAGGDYLLTNPNAPADQVSYRWNSMCLDPAEFSWGDLAVEWIKSARAWKAGHEEPMKHLKQRRLGLTWDPRAVNPFGDLPVIEVQTRTDEAGKKLFWPLQDYIFMGVDVQADHFWGLVVAWSKAGDECALWAGQLYSWEQIEEKQKEYGILDQDVGVDYSHRNAEVRQECARRGHIEKVKGRNFWMCWNAYRGSHEFEFLNELPPGADGKKRKAPMPFKWPPQRGNPVIGLRHDNPLRKLLAGRLVPIITWSNPSIKDIVMARRDGEVEAKVETARGDWNREYQRQMHSQRKVRVQPKFGPARWTYQNFTDDHLLDCRCMITVRAIRRGLVADVMASGEIEN